MSKRFQPPSSKPMFNKKPKLDISVSNKYYSNPTRITKTKNVDVWGDDDDDVILLASQALDKIEECSQNILIEHDTMLETSYSHFKVNVQSSTQVTGNRIEEELKDLLKDDDDFNTLGNFEINFQSAHKIHQSNLEMDKTKPSTSGGEFKMPNEPTKRNFSATVTQSNNSTDTVHRNRNQDNNKDIQVEYLAGKLEATKKENEKLNEEVQNYTEKFLTKEGEVSMLRQELQHLKRTNETLRLEKLQDNESSKKEYLDKIHELEKIVRAQKSEIEFKQAEMLNIKSKRMSDTQKLNDSVFEFRQDTTKINDLCFMFDLHLPLGLKEAKRIDVPPELFAKTPISNEKFREPLFRRELENLRCIVGKLRTLSESDEKYDVEVEKITKNVICSTKDIFIQAKKYAQQLKFTSYHDINPGVEHSFLSQHVQEIQDESRRSIFQEKKIYVEEKAAILRRVIGALSIVFDFPQSCCKNLYEVEAEGVKLFDLMTETIDLIGYSEELYNHFGVIEAFGRLLNTLAKNFDENSTTNKYLSELLKSLIFCRPVHRAIVEISKCLEYLTSKRENLELMNSLCTKNPKNSFIANETYKIFHFTTCACPLQVYGILLEVAIPQHTNLSKSEIHSLCSVCYSHIIFLRNCLERLPDWVWLTEDSPGECDCYIKLSTSYIVLFYLVLKQWINHPASIGIKIVKKICQTGVILLYNVFCSNYRREILQIGGSAVKNRLQMLHYWLKENQTTLEFTTIHTYALECVKLSHIISDPIRNSEENYTEQSRKEGEEIWEEIFKNFTIKTLNLE